MAINKRLIRTNDEAASGPSFNTVLYDGNGTTQSIGTVGFAPDLVWIKNRTVGQGHSLWDTVRGASSGYLQSQLTNAEAAAQNMLTFDAEGFNVSTNGGSYTQTNRSSSSDKYVAWCWKAGGAAVTNTDGTITSQVSANTEAGFSIVSYTGDINTGSSGVDTVGHGLGAEPSVVIIKDRDAAQPWVVYHKSISTGGKAILLNDSAAATTPTNPDDYWGNGMTSSVIGIGDSGRVNRINEKYIAYCFAEVAGFSKFGSYTGNGLPLGPTIDCGFEPAFVMVKQTTNIGFDNHWVMWDNKRIEYDMLRANTSDAEFSGPGRIRFLENGFEMLDNDTSRNASGGTYIYMAFANQF